MKIKKLLVLVFVVIGISLFAQVGNDKQWIKSSSTFKYSLDYEKKVSADFYLQNQRRYNIKIDTVGIVNSIKSGDEKKRLNAVKLLGLIPGNNQIHDIEYLLVQDTSYAVQTECVKSLKLLGSTSSIPVLIKALQMNDPQLRLEIALSLAALGEKTESLKVLKQTAKAGDRNVVLNTQQGYLDIANKDAIELLKTDLSDLNPYVSVNAAVLLGDLKDYEAAYPVLKVRLSDSDRYIRMAALRGLAYIGSSGSLVLIKGMLNDNDYLVQERSALILNAPVKARVVAAYNPVAAASYADLWWNAPNPAYSQVYYNQGEDCANFVSQCLIAGGLNLYGGGFTDSYGCIPSCDNLNTNLITYQGCTHSHLTGSYPSWFTLGGIAIFGENAASPGDLWQHATINVVTGTPALDAHTNNRFHYPVGYYYPSSAGGFTTGEFYDFSSAAVMVPPNDNCQDAVLLTSSTSNDYLYSQTVNSATASGLPKGPCDAYTGNAAMADVWYSFKALSTKQVVTVDPAGSQLDAVIVAYNSCSDNGTVACSDVSGGNGTLSTLTLSGLTIGNNYYIRVYDYGLQTNDGGFRICVTHASPAAAISAISDKIKVYPNPSTGKFELSGLEDFGSKYTIRIYDYLGRSIYLSSYDQAGSAVYLDLSLYPAGIYLVELSNDSLSCMKKIVFR